LDNTLFDHVTSARAGVEAVLDHTGCENTTQLQTVWLDLEREYFQQYLDGRLSFQGQRRARIRGLFRSAGLPVPSDDAVLDGLFAVHGEAARAAWAAFPDAVAALGRLRDAGLETGILTNGNHNQQIDKLSVTGLDQYVDHMFVSGRTGHAKPASEAFLLACEAMGRQPGEVIHVGDDPVADIFGARRAGLQAVLLDRAGRTASGTVCSLNDLKVLLPQQKGPPVVAG